MPALTVKKLYLAKSVEELAEKAAIGSLKKHSAIQLCNSAGKLIKEAELNYLDKDEERSYMLYMKFIDLVLQLQKRPDIHKVESSFGPCVKKLKVAFSKAEELKESLAKRYAVLREAADNEQKEKKENLEAEKISQSENAISKENKVVASEKEEIHKSKDELPDVLEKTISSEQLFNLLMNHQSSVVIMDVRLEADFIESHIKHSGCINIPAGILSPGITAARLEEKLPSSSLSKWKQRSSIDLIVLTDSNSKGEDVQRGSPLYSLREAMCKWDQSCTLKREPLVLDGGYEDWMLRYPMYTTKVIKFQIYGKKEIKKEITPDVTDVKYPDLDESFLKSTSKNLTERNENEKDIKYSEIEMPNKIVNGWISDTIALTKKENASTPNIDRRSKPKVDNINKWVIEHTELVNSNYILERQNSLEKSNKNVPSTPTDYSVKNIIQSGMDSPFKNLPVVDRTLKPSTVKATQMQINGVEPASANTTLIGGLKKEESKAKESLSNVKELLDKEKEFEKLRLQKELEAEESKRIEIQKQEIALMSRIKELEDESLKMEQEFKKIQDENINMKKLLEEQRDKEHQKQKEADIEYIEQKRRNAMLEVTRLREERKKREREEKKQREEIGATSQQQKNVSKEQLIQETNDKDTKNQNGILQEYTKHRPSEITIPLSKNLGGTGDGTSRGLTRSYSSPNIAQMVAQEENEDFPKKIPVVDRSLKPKTRDHAPIMADEISTIRQRNLNPIYGNNQGRPVTGIRNLGNTCFMNSTIQCLSNTAPLAQYFTTGQYRHHINRDNKQGTRGEIAEEFAIIIQALWMGQYKSFSPKDFKNTVSKYLPICIGNEQQDSHEFFVVLLDKLHADLNQPDTNDPVPMPNLESLSDIAAQETFWNYHKSQNRSKISEVFEGLLRSTLTCLHCRKTSSSYEVFSCLSLPISSSRCKLIDCLQTFLKPEKMSGEGAWDCPKCRQKKEAEKIMSICQLPNILVIQLKRFSYEGLWRRKLQTNVDFSTVLEMPYIVNTVKYYRKYSLYGVVNHFGTLEGGHYTAYCKNYTSGKWYKYDDHEVSEMSISDVKTPAAYLLFYASVDTKVISVL